MAFGTIGKVTQNFWHDLARVGLPVVGAVIGGQQCSKKGCSLAPNVGAIAAGFGVGWLAYKLIYLVVEPDEGEIPGNPVDLELPADMPIATPSKEEVMEGIQETQGSLGKVIDITGESLPSKPKRQGTMKSFDPGALGGE